MIDKKEYMDNLIYDYKKMIFHRFKNWKVMKSISEYQNQYKVCRNGLVYNRIKKKWLVPQQHKNGYLYVVLYRKGKRKNVYLHRLVAKYFVPNPTPKSLDVVYHLDGNKWNNRVNNIGWTSKSLLMREIEPDNVPVLKQQIDKARDAKLRIVKRREEIQKEWAKYDLE